MTALEQLLCIWLAEYISADKFKDSFTHSFVLWILWMCLLCFSEAKGRRSWQSCHWSISGSWWQDANYMYQDHPAVYTKGLKLGYGEYVVMKEGFNLPISLKHSYWRTKVKAICTQWHVTPFSLLCPKDKVTSRCGFRMTLLIMLTN